MDGADRYRIFMENVKNHTEVVHHPECAHPFNLCPYCGEERHIRSQAPIPEQGPGPYLYSENVCNHCRMMEIQHPAVVDWVLKILRYHEVIVI